MISASMARKLKHDDFTPTILALALLWKGDYFSITPLISCNWQIFSKPSLCTSHYYKPWCGFESITCIMSSILLEPLLDLNYF